MILTTYLTSLFGSKKKTIQLQGLTPVNLPPNHLWQQMCTLDNLQTAFDWLCKQTTSRNHNSDVWDYRRAWTTRKDALRQQLLNGNFQFATVRIVEIENDAGQLERREVRNAEDKLVIRAMTQVLQPVLPIPTTCTHVKGHGGLKPAVRDTQEYLAAHPDSFVMKSDVKGYAHIDHEIVMEQLHYCLPFEPEITQLVWLFLRRTTEFGGNYVEVQRGLPLAASISPLLGGLYLASMDALFEQDSGIFYRRYMDDWIIMQNKRHGLRKSVKMVYGVLDALGMQTHPDKTFIGKGNKGFDFLGFAICPTGLTVSDAALSRRDTLIATLYEQGASKRRIRLYLARWLGWASLTAAAAGSANNCVPPFIQPMTGTKVMCSCYFQVIGGVGDPANTSAALELLSVGLCASTTDTTCSSPPSGTNLANAQTLFFKNLTESQEFFSCKWDPTGGFTDPNAYTPAAPAAPAHAQAPVRVPLPHPLWTFGIAAISGVAASAWRRRRKKIARYVTGARSLERVISRSQTLFGNAGGDALLRGIQHIPDANIDY